MFVLARLVAPEAFGVVAATFAVLSLLGLLRDFGLSQTLIVQKDNIAETANTAFYISLGIGIGLFAIVYLSAPVIAAAMDNDSLTPVLRVTGINLVLNSLGAVPSALLAREMRFKTLTWPKVIGALGSFLVAVLLAWMGWQVWSIVWSVIAQTALDTLSVWLLQRWRPRWQFSRRAMREVFRRGKYLVSISMGAFLLRNVDTLSVGKFLGATALGYYNMAFNLSTVVPTMLARSVYPVLLPAYSEIQEQPERLARIHLRLIKYVLLVLTPACLLLALLAEDGIPVWYGVRWREIIIPVQILCLYGLVSEVTSTNAPILILCEKLKIGNYITYANLAVFLVFAWPAASLGGIIGISVLVSLNSLLNCLFTFLLCSRTLDTDPMRYLAQVALPFGAGAISAAAMISLIHLIGLRITDYSLTCLPINFIILSLRAAIFLLCYAAIVYFVDADVRHEVIRLWASLPIGKTLKIFQVNPG